MTRTLGKILIIAILSFSLMGCSFWDNKPSKGDMKNSLSLIFPGFVKVVSFTIEVLQNQGTEVDPVYRSRFKATLKVSEDLYQPDIKGNDVLFVVLKTPKGKKIDIFGRSTSVFNLGKWKHTIEIDGDISDLVGNLGVPLNQISESRVLISGSNEAKKYLTESAEVEREIRRNESELAKNLRNAYNLLIGTWKDENSIMVFNEDGTEYVTYDSGEEVIKEWIIVEDRLRQKFIKSRKNSQEEWEKREEISKYHIVSIDENNFIIKTINQNGLLGKAYHSKRMK